jgi:thiosulfate dehydrogenase
MKAQGIPLMRTTRYAVSTLLFVSIALCAAVLQADEFTDQDLKDWQAAYESVVKDGRAAFTDPDLGNNGVVCAQCHPNGANTHPETYPKFQKQIGKVVTLMEMTNWCLMNTLEGDPLEWDDPKMTALQAYMLYERRGVKLSPGKH